MAEFSLVDAVGFGIGRHTGGSSKGRERVGATDERVPGRVAGGDGREPRRQGDYSMAK